MIIFTDLDKILVDYLKQALTENDINDVVVSVKKSKQNDLKEVIITATYNDEITPVHRNASAVLDIYAPSFGEANTLSLIVEALIREATVDEIKKVEVILGPTRTTELSQSERRSISVDLVIKANNYNN
jgi:hypothetical protein